MALRRGDPPVLLTNYQALDVYLSEVRSIRESRVLEAGAVHHHHHHHQQQAAWDHLVLSQGSDSARGTDHESSEEEGEHVTWTHFVEFRAKK